MLVPRIWIKETLGRDQQCERFLEDLKRVRKIQGHCAGTGFLQLDSLARYFLLMALNFSE
ncbi:MAG: hypothetical protein A3G24_03080 [Betaproteobacteria bacterium RIFCSPLOWO2_12_FULL_62_13]|nr:MAG: hypothetical protein A3G24_03080 [Betaproteobacteria bacterium RIFCSPLOWO2_12_FULL_62_13]